MHEARKLHRDENSIPGKEMTSAERSDGTGAFTARCLAKLSNHTSITSNGGLTRQVKKKKFFNEVIISRVGTAQKLRELYRLSGLRSQARKAIL